jgi:hypothetical protein
MSWIKSVSTGNETDEHNIFLLRAVIATLLILFAAIIRIFPHPWNFTPVGAMAIFSGSLFRNRWFTFLLPLGALFAGDIFIGFHKLMFVVYASFALSVAIGRWLAHSRTVARIGGAVFLGALQFFLVTNFAVWALGSFYPKTSAGLRLCYLAGIPYFWNTLAGDVLYALILFGGYALAEKLFALPVEHAAIN